MDQRLFSWDVLGSIAHARMLGRRGIIPAEDAAALVDGLAALLRETTELTGDYEDVHSLVESRLGTYAGQAAARLHTARSRNDQVATDTRLFARAAVIAGAEAVADLQDALLSAAESVGDAVVPGYTHMQRAQPVLLAHHLLAYVEMLARDADRLRDAYPRVDVLPLGSGALAGSPYPLDREYVARLLGFSEVSHNSMDAVGDRDFLLEHLSVLSIIAMHLSRLAEELVLWSTAEFAFVSLDESMTTGSSIMPQKRNPDVAELLRGKTGRVYGALVALLVTLKGLPMAYNRDLQEDKGPYFEAVDLVDDGLRLAAAMVRGATWNLERMSQAADDALIGATDLADHLTRRGTPFRQAHEIVGRIVRRAEASGRGLASFSLAELREFSAVFAADAVGLQATSLVRARDVVGGTAPSQVTRQLGNARRHLAVLQSWTDAALARLPTLDSVRSG
ncbi:MAG: argininosuccinate lyase [Chloroflexota bacterium]